MSKTKDASYFIEGIKAKKLEVLGQAITLIESRHESHQKIANEVIKNILPLTGKSRRIGISGTPGVGKSTFLENFGICSCVISRVSDVFQPYF